jgi:hypothetical protein
VIKALSFSDSVALVNFSEMRLPHTPPNFDGACGIHLFVEFDLDVAPIQFLIIDSYLNCIDMSVNTRNYALRKLPVLRNVVLYVAKNMRILSTHKPRCCGSFE